MKESWTRGLTPLPSGHLLCLVLTVSKQRHNSLWRSKSETNLVSKDFRLKRKNNEDMLSSKNRIKEMNDKNDFNKENSNIDNLLTVPGTLERPKSWSPEDSAFEVLPKERNTNSRAMKNKRFNGRHRFGTDPSCYNVVEAMKKIDQNLIENSESSQICAKNKASTVKNRVTNFETQSQPTVVTDVLRFSSGKVYSLANQFESNNGVKQCKQKEVIIDLSNIEDLQKTLVHSKPPIPKQQVNDKITSRLEPQEISDILGKNSSDSSQYLANCLKLKSDKTGVEWNDFYMRDRSTELHRIDSNSFKAHVMNTKRKGEECNVKRTNSYDSILNELSLSLFDSQSILRSHEESKGHKRSSSLCSATTQLANRWSAQLDKPSSFSLNQTNRCKGFDRSDRFQSKSMPSVIEAVNQVLTSTRVIVDSIPDSSKTKSKCDPSVSMDCDSNESRVQSKYSKSWNETMFYSTNNNSKVLSVVRKSTLNTKKESDGVVKRLTEKIEAKVKGSIYSNTNESNESQHSQSTPSSPNFVRNERPRSSTLHESSDGPKEKWSRKSSFEFPIKRIKSQSCDKEKQSNRSCAPDASCHPHRGSAASKKSWRSEVTHQSLTQTKINAIESRHKTEVVLRAQPKKQQQGRSHPLTRLMPHTSLKSPAPALDA